MAHRVNVRNQKTKSQVRVEALQNGFSSREFSPKEKDWERQLFYLLTPALMGEKIEFRKVNQDHSQKLTKLTKVITLAERHQQTKAAPSQRQESSVWAETAWEKGADLMTPAQMPDLRNNKVCWSTATG